METISATLGGIGLGLSTTWTSPALLRIDEAYCLPDQCDISGVSSEQASWIAAVNSLGAAVALPVSGKITSYFVLLNNLKTNLIK